MRALAERLTDADTVRSVAGSAGDHGDRGSWRRLSLFEGYPGVGLLFAELEHHDATYTDVTRRYLDLAGEQLVAGAADRLFDGLAAVAFTTRAANVRDDGVLDDLDRHIVARANTLVVTEHKRTTASAAGTHPTTYDVTHGLAGLGAYLLTAHRHAFADVLTALVALSEPVTVSGRTLPGWWVPHPDHGGYVDLGMAHGIAGPLALLALAWRAGIRVAGHEQAMQRMADWLVARTRYDAAGPYWPATLTTAEELAGGGRGHPETNAWCHGTPGVARALQLAGTELGVPAWTDLAVAALTARLTADGDAGTPADASLCHGWSGLLHVTRRLARDAGDERLDALTHAVADQVIATFDSARPFGFSNAEPPPDRGGFLDGAAGIALALHSYAHDTVPTSGWDRALVLG